jgi:hypothetical protein
VRLKAAVESSERKREIMREREKDKEEKRK